MWVGRKTKNTLQDECASCVCNDSRTSEYDMLRENPRNGRVMIDAAEAEIRPVLSKSCQRAIPISIYTAPQTIGNERWFEKDPILNKGRN